MTYLKGMENVIADALSQINPLDPETEDRDNFGVFPVHYITSEIPPTGSQLEAVRVATQDHPVFSKLKHQTF